MDKNKDIELIMERLLDPSEEIQSSALYMLLEIVKGVSTLSSTSAANFDYIENNKYNLEQIVDSLHGRNKRILSDILSLVYVYSNSNLSVHYRLAGNILPLETFGHLYVKKLLGNVVSSKTYGENVKGICQDSISFLFSHNLECDAIDFSCELNLLNLILLHSDSHNYERIFLYLNDLKKYDTQIERLILEISLKMKDYPTALVFSIRNNLSIEEVFTKAERIEEKLQLAFMLRRLNLPLPQKQEYTEIINKDFSLFSISANFHAKEFFDYLVQDLQIAKPKKPLEFLKGNPFLRGDRDISSKYLSNVCLANAFVHLGFGEDSIFLNTNDEFSADLSALGDSAKSETLSVYSSFGAINYFSQKNTIDELNELIFSDFSCKKTSALLGLAISNSKIFDDNHTCLAFLRENLAVQCQYQQIATLLGLQMIYSHTSYNKVKPILFETVYSQLADVACFSAFCLGSIFCGSGDAEISTILLQVLTDSKNQSSPFFNLVVLGVGLLFFKDKKYSEFIDTLKNVTEFSSHCIILIKGLAHFGSGDVDLLNEIFADYYEDNESVDKKNNALKALALLAVALISSGDDLFTKMALRIMNSASLLEGDLIKSTIALCIALLSPSNPQLELVDLLVKYTNSNDTKTVLNGIFGLGIVGAGTNNTRISEILERLYSYNIKGSKTTNSIIIAQGLLHLGKGTMSLSPYIYHKNYLLTKNFVGLLAATVLLLEPEDSPMTNKYPFLNYFFIQASSLKQVICVNKDIEFVKSILKIGNPINLVGVVGKPKKIASIQTHESPIIVQDNEMVECNDKCITRFIEDVVVLEE